MRLFFILVALFILLPWLELSILLDLTRRHGLLDTFAIVIITGLLGAGLARHQGLSTVRRIRQAFQNGQLPADEILSGFMIFCAGLLLITPGLLTDSVGFLLLIPPVRQLIKRHVLKSLHHRFQVASSFTAAAASSDPLRQAPDNGRINEVIDVTATERKKSQ